MTDDDKRDEKKEVHNVTSHFQQGGITAHTVYVGKSKMRFSEEMGNKLLSNLSKTKSVELMSVGSNEDQEIATEFQLFLESHGIKVKRLVAMMLAPPPNSNIHLTPKKDEEEVISRITICPTI
jgi:hypothetical protein